RKGGGRAGDRAPRHRLDGVPAHRAVRRERRPLDAEHLLLRRVRIGDEAAFENVGGAGDVGERAGDEAPGARLGGGDLEPAHAAGVEYTARRGGHFLVAHGTLHGSRTVAVASAAMPSPRPVKPSRSLVVALTATRATST